VPAPILLVLGDVGPTCCVFRHRRRAGGRACRPQGLEQRTLSRASSLRIRPGPLAPVLVPALVLVERLIRCFADRLALALGGSARRPGPRLLCTPDPGLLLPITSARNPDVRWCPSLPFGNEPAGWWLRFRPGARVLVWALRSPCPYQSVPIRSRQPM
jgi:hypothetical protein